MPSVTQGPDGWLEVWPLVPAAPAHLPPPCPPASVREGPAAGLRNAVFLSQYQGDSGVGQTSEQPSPGQLQPAQLYLQVSGWGRQGLGILPPTCSLDVSQRQGHGRTERGHTQGQSPRAGSVPTPASRTKDHWKERGVPFSVLSVPLAAPARESAPDHDPAQALGEGAGGPHPVPGWGLGLSDLRPHCRRDSCVCLPC